MPREYITPRVSATCTIPYSQTTLSRMHTTTAHEHGTPVKLSPLIMQVEKFILAEQAILSLSLAAIEWQNGLRPAIVVYTHVPWTLFCSSATSLVSTSQATTCSGNHHTIHYMVEFRAVRIQLGSQSHALAS